METFNYFFLIDFFLGGGAFLHLKTNLMAHFWHPLAFLLEWCNTFGAISSQFKPFRVMFSHFKPFGAIASKLDPFEAILSHFKPFGAFLSHLV